MIAAIIIILWHIQVISLIVIGVTGAALSQVVNIHLEPTPEPVPNGVHYPPSVGTGAMSIGLIAACLSLFLSYFIAIVRVVQIVNPGVTFSNNAVVMIFSYLVSC